MQTNYLIRFLIHASEKHGLLLSSIEGGSLRNAIPRESFAIVVIPEANAADFEKCDFPLRINVFK